MIEVQELTKRYGSIKAIDNISFKVERGEILGFLGPNGAGKSTTMRILTGAVGPSAGRVSLGGFDVGKAPRKAKHQFGYMPEVPPVYPEMTVRHYVDYVARLHGVPRATRKEAVDKALSQVAISDVANRLIGHLSKGYQQRVGLAQAIVHEPPVLILDEPTVGLDPNQIMEIRQLIKNLAGKHTVILSTHILPEVQMTCQRVIIINNGRIVAQDTIENLSSQVQKSDRLTVLVRRPSENAERVLEGLEGVESVSIGSAEESGTRFLVQGHKDVDLRENVARLAVEQGWGLLELRRVSVTLEEVFRELTTEEQGLEIGTEVAA